MQRMIRVIATVSIIQLFSHQISNHRLNICVARQDEQ